MRKIILVAALMAVCSAAFAQKTEVREGNRDFKRGKFAEAQVSYYKAYLEDSLSVIPAYNLASAHYRQNNVEEAAALLDRYEDAAVGQGYADRLYFNDGNAAVAAKDWKKAVDCFRKSLILNPDDMDAKENYTYAKMMLEDQQNQQQDQNQDGDGGSDGNNQDQNKDQDQQDQDQQQDQGQDQQDDRQGQDGQPSPKNISKQQAQQILRAVQAREKETQDKVNKEKALKMSSNRKEKNW